ncbi:alpha-ketoglutarate-dependent dioxygenase AlkB [Sphingosinicella humi]|uniref:Alpha-ketoglutarate-dependent dioxygenase AlkB n=1 Tax=Allosphingosinicella humi TaxID=2068657 RepID=A0A2U2J631_9SPHN|nr:alpha-ketoglutarate-dependent dioxygenase AlkB [Sphingosinicella humi]PWG03790.1 alpha-ketoglutarate-dependent dioxygenase AlkB [Sphingosinicella humi]
MTAHQFGLFETEPARPEGLAYRDDFVSVEEERLLAAHISELPFKPFEFHGFQGNRRTVSFGWHYAFDGSGLQETEPIPPFLLPLRDRAARFAGLAPPALPHVLVIEYAPGAGIGWHRDRPVFDDVIGVSLLAEARLRFRRKRAAGWERATLVARPRSAYLLRGPARSEWEHSIPAMDRLRYSITFRSFREDSDPRRSSV